jgi:membrane-bound lytic murein transglycosylase D
MPFGFSRSGRPVFGPALKPLIIAFSLSLALPAQAGWFGLGSKRSPTAESETTAPASAPVSTLDTAAAPDAKTPAPVADIPDAPGNSAEDLANDEAVAAEAGVDAAGTDDDSNHEEGDEQDDDSVVLLPNVEESDLDDSDTPTGRYSPEELAALGNLWERLRKGAQMDTGFDNDRIAIQRNWYLKNDDYLSRMARRASRYLYYTVSEAEKRNMPTELALLPVIESAYDPFAYSHANAAGMWQFIPGTATIMGVKQNEWFDGRRDVIESTRAAYDFLSLLYGKFGDWQLALAAYNAGPGAVQRAINRNRAAGLPTDFWSLKLPAETRAYVPRFLAIAQIVKSPESFGVELRPLLNQPHFRPITIKGQVDITQAASIAGVSLKEFLQLNPGFKRQATDPEGPHRLLVPTALPVDFEADIAALPVPETVVAETYTVRKGDTLYAVARRFDVQPTKLKEINNLKSDKLTAGRTLTITRANVSPEFVALREELKLDRAAYASKRMAGAKRYKVRRGDTLGSIARRHGVSLTTLAKLNRISPKAKVRAGQMLTVRQFRGSTGGKTRIAKAGRSSKSASLRKIRYEVRQGDTLASISRRYKVSVTQIRRWNSSAAKLRPGQGLVLYVAGQDSRRM